MYAIPPFAMFFSWLILHRTPTEVAWIGSACVLLGVVLTQTHRRQRVAPVEPCRPARRGRSGERMIVRLGMAPRRPGMTFAQFQHYWSNEHGPVAEAIPGLRGYIQNHAILEDGRPLLPYTGFDACSEIAFDDLAAMDAGFASPTYQSDVQADELGFIDKPKFMMLLCDRRVISSGSAGEIKLLTFMRTHPLSTREQLLELAAGRYADALAKPGRDATSSWCPRPRRTPAGRRRTATWSTSPGSTRPRPPSTSSTDRAVPRPRRC